VSEPGRKSHAAQEGKRDQGGGVVWERVLARGDD
jgi:hypothetical protein